jgi:hypothetical protein
MFGKLLKSAATLSLLFVSGAAAQVYGTGALSPPAPGVIRVTVTTPQQFTPVPQGVAAEEQRKLVDATRRRIYESSLTECPVLSEVYKAECKLVAVTANAMIMNQGMGGVSISANGNATYDLTPRAP